MFDLHLTTRPLLPFRFSDLPTSLFPFIYRMVVNTNLFKRNGPGRLFLINKWIINTSWLAKGPAVLCLLISPNIACTVFRWYFDPFLGPWHVQNTISASTNQHFIGKLSLFLTKVSFDTSEGNQLSYFQISYLFKILW